jgi:hypothetical protein
VYSHNFPHDHKHIKLLGRTIPRVHTCFSDTQFVVYCVLLLETVQTALSGADLYYWFAAGFGKIDHLISPFTSFVDVPMMGSVVSLCVQFFFVYRIRVLSEKRSRWLCVIICLVTSSLKLQNEVIIPPVALPCRCIRGVHGRYSSKSPQFHVIPVSNCDSYTSVTPLWKVCAC